MIIFEIPIIFILAIVAFFIGGIYQITNHIFEIFLGLIYIVIYILLIRTYIKIYDKLRNPLTYLNIISLTFIWVSGIFFLIQLREIDTCGLNKYMSFLGQNELLGYLIFPIALILLVYIIFPSISYFTRNKIIKYFLCIIPLLMTLLFFNYSSNICTKSYSYARLNEFLNTENLEEHTLKVNTKIYYSAYDYSSSPSLIINGEVYTSEKSEQVIFFPILSPIKYSRSSFHSGETIFISRDIKKDYFNSEYYVEASNGKEVGYINVKNLE